MSMHQTALSQWMPLIYKHWVLDRTHIWETRNNYMGRNIFLHETLSSPTAPPNKKQDNMHFTQLWRRHGKITISSFHQLWQSISRRHIVYSWHSRQATPIFRSQKAVHTHQKQYHTILHWCITSFFTGFSSHSSPSNTYTKL